MGFKEDYEKTCKDVFAELEKTMASIDAAALERLTEDILNADQVFFVGVGRVMLALQCVCKRLAHLGIKAHYHEEGSSDCWLRLRRLAFSAWNCKKGKKNRGLQDCTYWL